MCHGGRLWINCEHTKSYEEISYPQYDETKGIIDESTEIDYIIDNHLVERLNNISHYLYILKTINEFSEEKTVTSYYKNISQLTKQAITGKHNVDDVFTFRGEVIGTHPNECCGDKTIFESFENGILKLKCQRLRRKDGKSEWEVDREYFKEVFVFNK
jgi:hypothetical protein